MTRQLREREAADEARRAQDASAAAAARGETERALEIERAERTRLEEKINERDRRDSLRDEITTRALTPSQSRMILRLADVSDANFNAASAVDDIVADYPDIFAPPPLPAAPGPQEQPGMRRAGPAPTPQQRTAPFEGFISPDEYARYPQSVRLTPEFRKRVEASKPYWPTTFNPHAFPQSN
jgi:hypothetical protein